MATDGAANVRKRNRGSTLSVSQSSLIGYLPAPDILENWIRVAGLLVLTSSTELERRIGS